LTFEKLSLKHVLKNVFQKSNLDFEKLFWEVKMFSESHLSYPQPVLDFIFRKSFLKNDFQKLQRKLHPCTKSTFKTKSHSARRLLEKSAPRHHRTHSSDPQHQFSLSIPTTPILSFNILWRVTMVLWKS